MIASGKTSKFILLLHGIVALLLCFRALAAAEPESSLKGQREKEDLAKQSSRTLYPFSSITLRDTWTPARWNAPDTANIVELRSLAPLRLWAQPTLFRIVVPYRTKFQAGVGLGDVRAFDLVAFKEPWGFWGAGPVVNMRRPSPAVADSIQAGPVTAVLVSARQWGIGLLNQNLFSAQVAVTTLQPILAYQFDDTWSMGLGELPYVYDWKQGRFLFAPIGIQIGAMFNSSGQWIRTYLNPQFNTTNIAGLSRWSLTYGVTFFSFSRQ